MERSDLAQGGQAQRVLVTEPHVLMKQQRWGRSWATGWFGYISKRLGRVRAPSQTATFCHC